MSPAVSVDSDSSGIYSHQTPQSKQLNNQSAQRQSHLATASEVSFNFSCSSPFPSPMGLENSSFSGRSKPKLWKVRKHSRSTPATAAENGSDFNPFRSVPGDSDRFKDATVATNGSVFGASKSSSMSSLNSEQLGNGNVGRMNNLGFVFGASDSTRQSSVNELNSVFDDDANWTCKLENRQYKENTGHSGAKEGFVFGANKSNTYASSKFEQRESTGNAYKFEDYKNLGSNKSISRSSTYNSVNFDNIYTVVGANKLNLNSEKAEFVFGSKLGSSESSLNKEMREPTEVAENFSHEKGYIKEDFRKHHCEGFEKKECSKNVGKPATNINKELDSDNGAKAGRSGSFGSVFGQSWSGLSSNSNIEKREHSEKEGRSVFRNNGKMKVGEQFGKLCKEGFIFGAHQSKSSSSLNFGKREFGGHAGQPVFENGSKGKVAEETGFQRTKCNGNFVFGSSSDKISAFSESSNLIHEKDKLTNATFGNGVEVNFKCNFVFGRSTNAARDPAASAIHNLSDDMRKLNVDNYENIGSAKDGNFNINSCAKIDNIFVFGSQSKASISSTRTSAQTSCDQVKNLNLEGSDNGGTVEKTDEVHFKTRDVNTSAFANNKDNESSVGGVMGSKMPVKMKNRNREPVTFKMQSFDDTSIGISIPKSFTFQSVLSKSMGGSQNQHIDAVKMNQCSFSAGESRNNSNFTSIPDGAFSFAANPPQRSHDQLELSAKARSIRDRRFKKMRGKGRSVLSVKQQGGQDHVSKERSSQKSPNPNSPGCCSPMDFSPYQDNDLEPSASKSNADANGKDEDLADASEKTDTIKENRKCGEPTDECSSFRSVKDCPSEEFVVGARHSDHTAEQVNAIRGAGITGAGSGDNMNTNGAENQHKEQFCSASNSANTSDKSFAFFECSTQDKSSAAKNRNIKRYRMKVGSASTTSKKDGLASSSSQFPPISSTYLPLNVHQDKKSVTSDDFKSKVQHPRPYEGHVKQGFATDTTQDACEKWRIRGNQAYKERYMSKAEEFYTNGINSVPKSNASGCYLEPLVLCYSNRAATRMSRGRMREALEDCTMAAALDSTFIKIHIRAANCHLALGEIEDAMQYYSKCMGSGSDVCLDRRIIIEAADGLQKAQKVAACMDQCAELLQQRTFAGATRALEIIADISPISHHSEKLLEMKGEAFLVLRKYEEVIQLCEQSLDSAEKNFSGTGSDKDGADAVGSKYKNLSVRLWRWRLMSKSYYLLGQLEVALDLLEKQELLGSTIGKSGNMTQGPPITLISIVRELIKCKNAGNMAFQSGRHTEAIEHYTAAISSSIESRPFTAICFCNRAAAYQALGQITDAIADCSLAIALDGNYQKAISRRATLHETIRDYEQAVTDIQRHITVLEKQSEKKVQHSGTPDKSTPINVKELRQARRRLSSLEEKTSKRTSLDLYLILGVKSSDAISEVKKAYRKAALRHHPDKAGQFLARSESGDDGQLWREIADEVQKDSDRLFKMIGEAYAVLSDTTKRSDYDYEEELRKARKDYKESTSSRRPSDSYSSPFGSSSSSGNRRHWQESWKSQGNSSSRW